MADNSLVPANEIWYTTTDGKTIKLQGSIRAKVASNTYKKREGKGVIVFNEPSIEIDNKTFYGFACLHKMILPEGVTSIGEEAFCYCAALQEVVIPSSVTSIGNSAFEDWTSLESIVIPKGVTIICGFAFDGCTSLTTVTLPVGVKHISYNAFHECSALSTIYVPAKKTDYYIKRLPEEELHDKIVELAPEKRTKVR